MAPFRTSHLVLVLLFAPCIPLHAQVDDIAYVPKAALERTADDIRISFRDLAELGMVELVLPPGTFQVDLLNAQGNVVREMAQEPTFDLRNLRPGTWTVRAHCPSGIRVRRFVVLGRGGTMWVDQRRMR